MPELPDVEGFRRVLLEHAVEKRIGAVDVRDGGIIRNRSGRAFARQLEGRVFGQPQRRGKWLLAPTNGPTLLLHFGMTGRLVWSGPGGDPDRLDRVVMEIDGGTLAYRDLRKLRGLWLADSPGERESVIGPQGPDAEGLTGEDLFARLDRHRGSLKALLMNQRVIAGLGNMLSDEVLWRARIHPERSVGMLTRAERTSFSRALQRVLKTAIKQGCIPRRRTWLSSQRSMEYPLCPRCHGELRTSRIAGRTSYWCPARQPPSG